MVAAGDNVVRDEVLYTYEAAVNKYEAEKHHEWLCRQRRMMKIKEEQKEYRRKLANQKLGGLIGVLAVIIATILDGNIVCLVLCFPGIYAMVTNKLII